MREKKIRIEWENEAIESYEQKCMPKDFKALHKNRVLTKIVSQNFLISKEKGQYLCAIIYIVSIIHKQTSCLEAQFS